MRSTTFQSALASAARVAGCAALIACRPPVSERAYSQLDTGGVVSGDSAYEPLETGTPQDSTTAPEGDAECEAYLDTTFADWDWETSLDEFRDNEDVIGCCLELGESSDAEETWDFPHRDPCCSLLDWQGPVACTPWGPPRPPAMTGVA